MAENTTAHTEADFVAVTKAFRESVQELQEAEFIPQRKSAENLLIDANKPPTDGGSDRLARALGDGLIALAACFVVVTILKGKLKLGLLGIVFAPLAIVGAVRLAKPSSIWARQLYPQGGRRLRRSEARSASRAARWTRRRERFYDLIGGAPHLGSKRDSAATPK